MKTNQTALVPPENPIEGAGDAIDPHAAPEILYHGTNPLAAAAILRTGKIKADWPVDGDEDAVVCLTQCPDMGKSFAIEFIRLNSQHDVGFVFEIDGKACVKYLRRIYPYHAESAGIFEFEFRIEDDIPLDFVKNIKIVGDAQLLNGDSLASENMFSELWQSAAELRLQHLFQNQQGLWKAVQEVVNFTR